MSGMMIITIAVATAQVCVGIILLVNILWLRRKRAIGGDIKSSSSTSVTVVVPARNEAENLRRLIPSLLTQRHRHFNVVIYDDGSDDETWDVIESFDDSRLRGIRGEGPPEGWVGKVYALYRATRGVSADLILFLDADVELKGADALGRLVTRYVELPPRSVMSGLIHLRGGAPLLVSLVPFTILGFLPMPTAVRSSRPALGALSGGCWMIASDLYKRLEPHLQCRDKILEDIEIGRYLKEQGVTPWLLDLQDEVAVHMYPGYGAAWHGFRKNAYLVMGGRPWVFLPLFVLFALVFAIPALLSPWLLIGVYLLKALSDGFGRYPPWVTLLAPLSFALASMLQLDSAAHHWLGRVSWKGRLITPDGG